MVNSTTTSPKTLKSESKDTKITKQKLPKIPSIWANYSKVWFELSTFWRPIFAILAVYAILYFVLVLGFNFSSGQTTDSGVELSKFNQAIIQTTSIFSSNRTDSTSIVQFLLFIIASLSFIWMLRQLQSVKKIKIRDAYYLGTATFVPAILVTAALALTMFPAIAGSLLISMVYQVQAGGLELIIASAISLGLLILSLYLFAMLWPAFYIVTLPQTRPIQSLKTALKITKTRRLALMRNIAVLFLLTAITISLVIFPFALLLPSFAPLIAYLLIFLFFGIAQIYFYNLYRSMI